MDKNRLALVKESYKAIRTNIILSIVKSVKANNALKLDPDNTALAEDVKKCKKNMFIWIGVAVACIAMVLVTYFAYIILLAIFHSAM